MSLFLLLTILNPDYSEYHLRRGIAAQMSAKYELAITSYAAASELDSNLIESRLFSAECYLKIGKFEKAKEEFWNAKAITENMQVDDEIVDLLNSVESTIKNN